MKNLTVYSVLLITCILALTSCTVQKRHYRNGYHVDFNQQIEGRTSPKDIPEKKLTTIQAPQTGNISESPDLGCEVSVNEQIGEGPTKVTLTDAQNISTSLSAVGKYPSVMSKAEAGVSATQKSLGPPDGEQTTNKSQLVALLLCLFFGLLGIHRFYLGYIGIGLIQLFTAGGCGIWALIDLILIITGDLKPKNGEYGSKL